MEVLSKPAQVLRIVLSNALTRLRGYTGWPAPLLFMRLWYLSHMRVVNAQTKSQVAAVLEFMNIYCFV